MRLGKKSKSFWKQMKMNTLQSKPMGHSEGSPESEVHSKTDLTKKDRNISNKQPNPMPIRTSKIEVVIKKLLAHKSPELDSFTGKFYQMFKKERTPILLKLF